LDRQADSVTRFGGTDGNYHYNDTWAFDTTTNEWTELSCIGYIPVPREGHAAAIVDGTIYIFGGRDVNGKDLGDLAAFRITSASHTGKRMLVRVADGSADQRWYMFQNMGPAPTARSGHALVAAHGKIYVLGGEANASSGQARDDPSIIHILDTGESTVLSHLPRDVTVLIPPQSRSNTLPTINHLAR
jgi:hypothetical protein